MRNENRGFLTVIENYVDMAINLFAIAISYVFVLMLNTQELIPIASPYTVTIIFVDVIVSSFVYHAMGLYKPGRYSKPFHSFPAVFKANAFFFGATAVVAALITRAEYKSVILFWILFSAILSSAFLTFKRHSIKVVLRNLRSKQYHLRKVIIVGDNTANAREYIKEVSLNSQFGFMVLGYVGDRIASDVGVEKLGSFKDLAKVLDKHQPSDVVFAIDSYDKKNLIRLVNLCDDRCIKVYFLPVIYGFFKSSRQIEQVGSVPLINIHSTPLDNMANAAVKRIVDIIGSLTLILLTWPIMLFAAIGVYISSPGPILFKQRRVGRLGKKFTMLKFRSMRIDTKSDGWTVDNDPRKTKFGNFIRKTSIDELPQLFNVLMGSMSLVGPRPEIPVFVEHFKEIIPLYMVKHYVKPGMTGLAQIEGLRGDTSIEDRIHADIEYIENWSLMLDLYILFKTPFKAINKNEKYKKNEAEENTEESENGSISDAEMQSDAQSEDTSENSAQPKVLAPTGDETFDGTESAAGVFGKPKGKMRILYVASTMSHINSFHRPYIDALIAEGCEVFTLGKGEDADYNIPFAKRFFSVDNRECRKRIRRIVERGNFDAILLNTTLAAFHVRRALPKASRPRIVNLVHGYLFSRNSGFVKRSVLLFCEKIMRKKTDAIMVMNSEDMAIASKNKLCEGEVYYTGGMGVKLRPTISYSAAIRESLGDEGAYALTFVGELSDRKNQRFLIEAMPLLREKIPSVVLWLVGEGILEGELVALAERLGVSDCVRFLGYRKDACDIMKAADLYVSASKSEGMPFNIIEAMGCGKTIIASHTKGQEDIIRDGVSGFFYDGDDVDGYVSAVVRVYKKEATLEQSKIIDRYKQYSFDEVFSDTYSKMKSALGIDMDEPRGANEDLS